MTSVSLHAYYVRCNVILKVKVTVLEDNDPLAEYRYLLTVTTGHRCGASTSSQVSLSVSA